MINKLLGYKCYVCGERDKRENVLEVSSWGIYSWADSPALFFHKECVENELDEPTSHKKLDRAMYITCLYKDHIEKVNYARQVEEKMKKAGLKFWRGSD